MPCIRLRRMTQRRQGIWGFTSRSLHAPNQSHAVHMRFVQCPTQARYTGFYSEPTQQSVQHRVNTPTREFDDRPPGPPLCSVPNALPSGKIACIRRHDVVASTIAKSWAHLGHQAHNQHAPVLGASHEQGSLKQLASNCASRSMDMSRRDLLIPSHRHRWLSVFLALKMPVTSKVRCTICMAAKARRS